MNKQPVSYMQTDPRWSKLPYQTNNEKATIGGSGCGPTCAAMLIETMTGKTFTPEDACNWSMKHGYKATGQGTYYTYFKPQFAEFGIECKQLNSYNIYGDKSHSLHDKVFKMLKEGYYIIACMGKGTWTKSGHFVVVWWENGKVCINDPASKAAARTNGDISTFKSQVKYYFAVDARKFNAGNKEPEKPKSVKVDPAASFGRTFAKAYKVNTAALNMRAGAGTKKAVVDVLEKGESFRCYGYYTKAEGVTWLYGVNSKGQTGYCSKKYLK